MSLRMLCMDCLQVDVPDTLLPGDDRVELFAWAFGIPGLLYCWWRHLARIKICAACGSPELMREARAAARSRLPDAPASSGPRIANLSGPVRWPQGLRAPRTRMWRVGVAACLACVAWLVATFGLVSPLPAVVFGTLLLGLAWLIAEGVRLARLRARCRAWDAAGRSLTIEQA